MTQLQRLAIAPSQIHQTQIILNPAQQHYLCRVLRLGDRDRFIAIDGIGNGWVAQLLENKEPGDFQAEILEAIALPTELSVAISLIVAMPKNGLDDVIRQATELGVSSILPVRSDRTLLKPSSQKLERWQRIAAEAAEQSERPIVPTVLPPQPFRTCLQRQESIAEQKRYICVARGSRAHLIDCLMRDRAHFNDPAIPIAIAIGPEGGWTEAEIEIAIAAGFEKVSLGSRILRAVTAPIVALSLVVAALESQTFSNSP